MDPSTHLQLYKIVKTPSNGQVLEIKFSRTTRRNIRMRLANGAEKKKVAETTYTVTRIKREISVKIVL